MRMPRFMTNEWYYYNGGTIPRDASQQIFGSPDIMAATEATYAFTAAMKTAFLQIRCED